jgi:hypothetical protein
MRIREQHDYEKAGLAKMVSDRTRTEIILPKLHAGQIDLFKNRSKRNVVCCGRRWGKSLFLVWLAARTVLRKKRIAVITPERKQYLEVYQMLCEILRPIELSFNRTENIITIKGGGRIDFWTLNDNYLACRGPSYDLILGDEIAFSKDDQMSEIWAQAIQPTLLTTGGVAWMFSTPHGIAPGNFFYQIAQLPNEWTFHTSPTGNNPFVPVQELDKMKATMHPMVYRQEILAEFIDWSGDQFFSLDKLLHNGKPVQYPIKTDHVFAVIDTAIKSGKQHDGTAVIYCALNELNPKEHQVIILDWDIIQVDGALLEHWLPSVFDLLNHFTKMFSVRQGNAGIWIEDAAAGSILLQQGKTRGWATHTIDTKLLMLGKDERAISVSGHFHQDKIKISEFAYDKVTTFKDTTRNHLLSQISSYRVGDKDAYKRADDLLDVFCYAIAISCGDYRGF